MNNLSAALQLSLDRYLAKRREIIPVQGEELMGLKSCWHIQRHHFLKDLIWNPLNTLWAIPYLSIRKVFEVGEKLGVEIAGTLLPKIPKSVKTGFQREMERKIQVELFGLSNHPGEKSELARELEKDELLRLLLAKPEWQEAVAEAEADIRKVIADFCTTHNGFTDLAASGGVLLVAQRIFRDSSLDIFGIARRWAGKWAKDKAVSNFVFGRKLGGWFYQVVPPPAATSKQIFWATTFSLALLSLFSTAVNILSYPVQNKIGFQKKQMDGLIQAVEDKLLLRFLKNLKGNHEITAIPTSPIAIAESHP